MNIRNIALGTFAYATVTFPIAVVWHLALFKEKYTAFGYFTGEPNLFLGLISILIQGAVLSALFPLVSLAGTPVIRGLKFSAIVGVFFWTSHVLALVAKQEVLGAPLFVAMETGYLAVQFGVFGVLIAQIYKRFRSEA
jgi:hypothetical protein